jgi:hypothetical protein
MVDAFHEEMVTKVDKFKANNDQLDSVSNPNEIQPNSEVVLMTIDVSMHNH